MWLDRHLVLVTKGCQNEQFAHAVFPSTFAELVKLTGGSLLTWRDAEWRSAGSSDLAGFVRS